MYRASDGARLGSYTFMDDANTNTPSFPYAVTAKSDGTRAYVASQRDGSVYILNTTDPGNIILASKITNLSQPSALLLNKAQTLLYVANAESDTISVVDVADDQAQVKATVLLRPSDVTNLPGVSPSGLALSPDEKTLYASLGDFNAVGVIDTADRPVERLHPRGMVSDGSDSLGRWQRAAGRQRMGNHRDESQSRLQLSRSRRGGNQYPASNPRRGRLRPARGMS